MNKKYVVSALFLMLFSSIGFAKDLHFESGDYQNTLLELYTSEGCSSCPPADKWLSALKHHPQLFSEIVPIAFHVDYWDYIGWRDEFADSKYSQRQRKHYRQRNVSSVYTPGLLRNGKQDRTWRYKRGDLSRAKTGKLSVDVVGDTMYVNFEPTKKHGALIANVALLGSGFSSKVTAGENRSKVLKHDFVVLDHVQKTSKANRWSIKLPKSSKMPERLALAVWVSDTKSLKPIQVIGSWL